MRRRKIASAFSSVGVGRGFASLSLRSVKIDEFLEMSSPVRENFE